MTLLSHTVQSVSRSDAHSHWYRDPDVSDMSISGGAGGHVHLHDAKYAGAECVIEARGIQHRSKLLGVGEVDCAIWRNVQIVGIADRHCFC